MKPKQDWIVLLFVALFLTIPLSTIPGLFSVIFGLIGLITLALVAVTIWLWATRRAVKRKSDSLE
jgi:uncharacterized membrane protein YbhN (UPF0104 family)